MLIYLQLIDDPREKASFERLFRRYRGLMFHVAKKILCNESDAEDAVHQAFLDIAGSMNKISDVQSPRTRALMVLITERRAIDLLRRQRDELPLNEDCLGLSAPLPGDKGLADAMARLPAEARTLLLWHYDNGYSVRELAKLLSISEAAVYKRIVRAKTRLKELLEEEGIEV